MTDAATPVSFADIRVNPDAVIERMQLDDTSWVDVGRSWVEGADALYEALLHGVSWQSSRLFRYDHWVEERRLGSYWRRGLPLPHPALAEITKTLQRRYRATFDGFGLIHYRDARDGQAFHRDTDMRWLDDTVVAILTLGAKRPWLLRPWASKLDQSPTKGATHDLAPASGDLIVMGGRCQADWQHSVPYLAARGIHVEPRISVQWRYARRTGKPFIGSSYRAPLTYRR